MIGAYRLLRCRTTEFPCVSIDATGASSLARADRASVLCRSSDCFTASALNGVPSLNLIPVRSGIVMVFLFVENFGIAAASCGTMFRCASMS